MPLLSNIDASALGHRRDESNAVAAKVPLVHVDAIAIDLISNPPHEIPTYATGGKTANTARTEGLLGLGPSAYFYAGRAHPKFGSTAFAFPADCENGHTGSATPFDSGGLLREPPQQPPLKLRLHPTDGESERVEFGKTSVLALDAWRKAFGIFLAAFFDSDKDYWVKKPKGLDPEGMIELNDDWRAWTFEIRFGEGHSVFGRAAWCADEMVMSHLRRLSDAEPIPVPGDPPTPLDRFFAGPPSLEPAGTPQFCQRLEEWVRRLIAT